MVERLRVKKAVRVLDSHGLPNATVNDVTMRDCLFEGVTQPSIIRYTLAVNLERVHVNGTVVKSL